MVCKGLYDLTGPLPVCAYSTQHWGAIQYTHNHACSGTVHVLHTRVVIFRGEHIGILMMNKNLKRNKLLKPNVSPACIGCLEWFTNNKSKYSCPVGTAGLYSFVVLLLLLQHWSSQDMYTLLGTYSKCKISSILSRFYNSAWYLQRAHSGGSSFPLSSIIKEFNILYGPVHLFA